MVSNHIERIDFPYSIKQIDIRDFASFLLHEIIKLNKNDIVKIINTDVLRSSVTDFLKSKNIDMKGMQFEMIKPIRKETGM